MFRRAKPELPDDLHTVEERLRHGRTQFSETELDGFRRRVLARAAADGGRPTLVRSRTVAAATALVLLGSAGGAVALAGLDSHPNTQGGAANHQYQHHKYCTHGNPPPGKKCKGVGSGKGTYGQKHRHHHGKKHHHGTGKGHGSHKHSHHHHHNTTRRTRRPRGSHHPRRLRGFTG